MKFRNRFPFYSSKPDNKVKMGTNRQPTKLYSYLSLESLLTYFIPVMRRNLHFMMSKKISFRMSDLLRVINIFIEVAFSVPFCAVNTLKGKGTASNEKNIDEPHLKCQIILQSKSFSESFQIFFLRKSFEKLVVYSLETYSDSSVEGFIKLNKKEQNRNRSWFRKKLLIQEKIE